jgi:hypothetical protein
MEDRIIPYQQVELKELTENPIDTVILGPKNLTPEGIVQNMLGKNGFKYVKVIRSEASYR